MSVVSKTWKHHNRASGTGAGDYNMNTINKIGLAEIHKFLAEKHRLGGAHFDLPMLRAWAADAEFQMAEGNSPTIEIRASDAVSGHAECYKISEEGVDYSKITYYADLKIAVNETTGEEAHNVVDADQAAGIWGSDTSVVTITE